jgi:transcriptional regulator with XRE-family HTH domain
VKPGTNGFVGRRLREAREARGITAVSLAEILGVTRAAISQYEHGPRTPSPEIAERIASTLRLPLSFFMRPANDRAQRKIFYRSLSAATKAARVRSERKYEYRLHRNAPHLFE